MAKLVRATNPDSGATFTTSETFAKAKGLKYRVEGATDTHGRIRRASTRTDKAGRPVNASMSREDLEAAAADAGVPEGAIAAAKNKGQLVAAIKTHNPEAIEADTTTDAPEGADTGQEA